MREIVTVDQVGGWFLVLAVAMPLLGLVAGMWWGLSRRQLQVGLLRGLLIGLVGPLNLAMWRIFNAVTDRNGLDSVKNVWVNLALFVVVGLVLGVGLGWLQTRTRTSGASTPAFPADETVG